MLKSGAVMISAAMSTIAIDEPNHMPLRTSVHIRLLFARVASAHATNELDDTSLVRLWNVLVELGHESVRGIRDRLIAMLASQPTPSRLPPHSTEQSAIRGLFLVGF